MQRALDLRGPNVSALNPEQRVLLAWIRERRSPVQPGLAALHFEWNYWTTYDRCRRLLDLGLIERVNPGGRPAKYRAKPLGDR